MRINIELVVNNEVVNGLIHQDNRSSGQSLSKPRLDSTSTVVISKQLYTLGDLVSALISYNETSLREFFDERGQLELGHHLYEQTLGQLPQQLQAQLHQADFVDVRIVTSDEHLIRLPWPLLADRGIFLCTDNWSVSLSADVTVSDCELPPSPRILVVAPQPTGIETTYADQHLEQFAELLSTRDPLLTWGQNLCRVQTWSEFTAALDDFAPQVIYYYGHGVGDEDRTRLLFANDSGGVVETPITDLRSCLRNMAKPPLIVYANCCLGDAAGFLGAGRQLEDFVPVVLTNRTVATIQAAQAQAMIIWDDILIRGRPPHLATAKVYGRLTKLNLSTADVRWLTPVLHCGYNNWKANPPTSPDRQPYDSNWHLKIDRVTQYAVVAEQTRQMLRARKPHSHIFIWYGRAGEGIEIFHQRLNVELRESLFRTHLYQVRPEWPIEFENFHRSCEDMFLETFGIGKLSDLAARIRSETAGAIGTQTLVYVRHTPIQSDRKVLTTARLQRYLQWWDAVLVPMLEERQQHALLGISFEVKNPTKFQAAMDSLEDLDLQNSVVRVLDEMEHLALRDLRAFVRTHNINVDPVTRDEALKEILSETNGEYELTVRALRNVEEKFWNHKFDENESEEDDADEDDW